MTSDDALLALVDAGYRWIGAPGYDLGAGRVPRTMLWLYAWEAPFIDLVHLRGRDDVTAVRARTDTTDDDLFALGNVVWQRESDIVEAVADLLALAAPGEPGAPTLAIRAPSRLWTPADGASNANPSSYLPCEVNK